MLCILCCTASTFTYTYEGVVRFVHVVLYSKHTHTHLHIRRRGLVCRFCAVQQAHAPTHSKGKTIDSTIGQVYTYTHEGVIRAEV